MINFIFISCWKFAHMLSFSNLKHVYIVTRHTISCRLFSDRLLSEAQWNSVISRSFISLYWITHCHKILTNTLVRMRLNLSCHPLCLIHNMWQYSIIIHPPHHKWTQLHGFIDYYLNIKYVENTLFCGCSAP